MLLSAFIGWTTRKAVNCLSNEIQDYVNCEDLNLKPYCRKHFQHLFGIIVERKLWLQHNEEKLRELKIQHYLQLP